MAESESESEEKAHNLVELLRHLHLNLFNHLLHHSHLKVLSNCCHVWHVVINIISDSRTIGMHWTLLLTSLTIIYSFCHLLSYNSENWPSVSFALVCLWFLFILVSHHRYSSTALATASACNLGVTGMCRASCSILLSDQYLFIDPYNLTSSHWSFGVYCI